MESWETMDWEDAVLSSNDGRWYLASMAALSMLISILVMAL